MHPKGADSMAISGLCFESTLVGSEWATAVLLCTNGLRNSPLALHGTHFRWGSIYPSLGERLPAECVTIASSLMDGCKCIFVEFGG